MERPELPFTKADEAQSRLLEIYASMITAANASIAGTLQSTERLQRTQIAHVSEYFAAQSRLAARGFELWGAMLGTAQDAQGVALSAAATAERAWNGENRRKAVITPYSGAERRKAA